MSKRTMRMVYTEHGLIPEHAPKTFEPLTVTGIVHNIIEHTHGGDPPDPTMGTTLHDEVRAFGAAHWIRGQGEYWCRTNGWDIENTTAPQNTHSEIAKLFIEWAMGVKSHTFESCPYLIEPVRKDEESEVIHFVLSPNPNLWKGPITEKDSLILSVNGAKMTRETMRLLRDFNGDDLMWGEPDDARDVGYDRLINANGWDIERWLQVGWIEAEKRFSQSTPWDVVAAWIWMEKTIDAALVGLGHGTIVEVLPGDILIVTWDDTDPTGFTVEWDDTEDDDSNEKRLIKFARAAAKKLRTYEDLDDTTENFSSELRNLENTLDEMTRSKVTPLT